MALKLILLSKTARAVYEMEKERQRWEETCRVMYSVIPDLSQPFRITTPDEAHGNFRRTPPGVHSFQSTLGH